MVFYDEKTELVTFAHFCHLLQFRPARAGVLVCSTPARVRNPGYSTRGRVHKVSQSAILSGCALGCDAKLIKAAKVVILGLLARANRRNHGIGLSPHYSVSSVIIGRVTRRLPKRYPESSFTPLSLPGDSLEEP